MYFGKPPQFIDAIRLRYEIIKSNISLRDKLLGKIINRKGGGGFRGRGEKREGQRGKPELKG